MTDHGPHRWKGTTRARVAGAAEGLRPPESYGGGLARSSDGAGSELGAALAEASPGPVFGGSTDRVRQTATVRVLIAIEDRHRVYHEAIGEFLRASRSHLELRLANPRTLDGELRRFGPQIVVLAGPPVPIPASCPVGSSSRWTRASRR